jgi:hypothetical protein
MAKEKMTKGQTTIYKITTRKTKDRVTGTLLKTRGPQSYIVTGFVTRVTRWASLLHLELARSTYAYPWF